MSHSIREHANQRGTAHFYMEDELLTLNDNATEHTIPMDYVIHDGKLCFLPKMPESERQPLSPESQGEEVEIVVKIGYPGSAVSDILIGDFRVQVPNSELMKAGRRAAEQDGAYYRQIVSAAMFDNTIDPSEDNEG